MKKNYNLENLAKKEMQDKGLQPEFSAAALEDLKKIQKAAPPTSTTQDLRSLLWCSIDNDDSRDLDQLTFAQKEKDGTTTLWIAIADVDALVPKDSPIDLNAQVNTTSVYTPAKVFPMLPEKLSTDLTSLNENVDRQAIVVKVGMKPDGELVDGTILQGWVRNYAKLTYNAMSAWLAGDDPIPEKVEKLLGLEETLRCQHETAQILKKRRHSLGALTLDSPEVEAKLQGEEIFLKPSKHGFADELIEHFMIAANHVMATHLRDAKIPSLRRVVRIPKNWDRIVEIAFALGDYLPDEPDSKALENFLVRRKGIDPETFPDLSLTVIKLLGRGEYVVEMPGDKPIGHFGLALQEYTHSTAPNRRYPDLISQRQYKALVTNQKNPYSNAEIEALASHCTRQEDAAAHVERHMSKVAAAILLSPKVGAYFKAIITGINENGTWVRIFDPPVEGKLVKSSRNQKVGEQLTVQLTSLDIPKGHINFSAKG
jgi:exoribonuclease-2